MHNVNAKPHLHLEQLQVSHESAHHEREREAPQRMEKIESAENLDRQSPDKGRLLKLESVFLQEGDDLEIIQA